MRIRGRRWLGAILLLVGTLLIALFVLFLFREPILRRIAETRIRESTGLRAEIGELKSTLGSSAFEVRNLVLYNLKEFGDSVMARVPELVVDLDTDRAAQGVLHLRRLYLNLAELHVIRNQDGRYNLDGVEHTVREHIANRLRERRDRTNDFQFGGIDQLQLTLRQVQFKDLNHPERVRKFDLKLENEVVTTLRTEEDLQTWLGNMIFRIILQQTLRTSDPQPPAP